MAKTKSFSSLVRQHVKGDAKFADALRREALDAIASGDLTTGKTILRDYIKATIVRSPHSRARNAGTAVPDFASLSPGYGATPTTVIARRPKADEAISAADACASEARLLRFARNDAPPLHRPLLRHHVRRPRPRPAPAGRPRRSPHRRRHHGSHILTNEGILDSFGHISARSEKNPDHFFIPRAMPPALVVARRHRRGRSRLQAGRPNAPRLNGERYIHCQVYQARSDVQSVIHTHDLAVIPFGLAGVPLKPVVAQAGFLPPETPLFEVRDANAVRGEARHAGAQRASRRRAGQDAGRLSGRADARPRRDSGRPLGARGDRRTSTPTSTRRRRRRAGAQPKITALDDAELATNAAENFDADRPWQNYRSRLPAGR